MNPLKPFVDVLRKIGIPFTVVGSVASSAHGIPRGTRDVDMVLQIEATHAEMLADALGPEWYADTEQIQAALGAGRAFNVIHLISGWKIDVFPAQSAFHRSEMRRASLTRIVLDGEAVECPVSSAEDVLLGKLRWYLDGGSVSERQWDDIGGIVAANPDLDIAYLREWAERLDVSWLLDRALGAGT